MDVKMVEFLKKKIYVGYCDQPSDIDEMRDGHIQQESWCIFLQSNGYQIDEKLYDVHAR